MIELPYYCEVPGHKIKYHHDQDAGLDLPIWDEKLTNGELSTNGRIYLKPFESVLLKTGVYMAIPEGHYGLLDSRSSTSKLKLDLLCRIIDSPFRGNIRVSVINLNPDIDIPISNQDELFQIVIQEYTKITPIQFHSKEEFLEYAGTTARGEEGFGSKERHMRSGLDG